MSTQELEGVDERRGVLDGNCGIGLGLRGAGLGGEGVQAKGTASEMDIAEPSGARRWTSRVLARRFQLTFPPLLDFSLRDPHWDKVLLIHRSPTTQDRLQHQAQTHP